MEEGEVELKLVQLFTKNSVVEVSSDDEGFKDAWFVATILEIPTPKSKLSPKRKKSHPNSFLVEYHTLVSDIDISKPLREYVQSSLIRPVPPVMNSEPMSLELNDVVDAFYRDGWWTGVVTKIVVKDLKFKVYFQNPPEEVEFERKDLRVHQDWVSGKWVRPEKQKMKAFVFSAGSPVEVILREENSCDVWVPAIVSKEIGDNSFVVEYQSSRKGDEPGIATVDFRCIRPRPPDLRDKNFELLEKVDAFFDFGWRSGIVTKVLAGGRYTVFFKHMNKDMNLSRSELRPHLDWTNGKWLIGSQEVLVPSDHQGQSEQAANNGNNTEMSVELKRLDAATNYALEKTPSSPNLRKNEMENSISSNEKLTSSGATSRIRKVKHRDLNDDATHSRSSKKLRDNAAEVPSCPSEMTPVNTSSKEALSGSATPFSGSTGIVDCSKQPIIGNQPAATTRIRSCRKRSDAKQQSASTNQNSGLVKRMGERTPISLLESAQVPASASGNSGTAEELQVPIVVALKATTMKGARASNSCELPKNESSKPKSDPEKPMECKSKDIEYLGEIGVKTQLKRRGRPRKIVSPKVPAAGEEHIGAGGTVDAISTDEVGKPLIKAVESTCISLIGGQKMHLKGPARHKNVVSNIIQRPLARKEKLPNDRVVQSGKQLGQDSLRRGRKRSISVNDGIPTEDFQGAARERKAEGIGIGCVLNEAEKAVPAVPNNTADDDRPLSMWFEGKYSQSTVDDPRRSLGNTMDKGNVTREKQGDTNAQSLAINGAGDIMLVENQNSPFVKGSPVWKAIESMDVFRKMPQNPHFHPLDKFKEEVREGLAIGSMVTFASLVEKTSKLQFDDPRSIFDSSLDTLVDLEMQGFDVKLIRDRINELLSIRDKQVKLQDQSKEVEKKIVEHTQEKTKIEVEIDEIQMKIVDLQEKLEMIKSMKESKDSEISSLTLRVDDVNESMRTVQHDFERLAASPL